MQSSSSGRAFNPGLIGASPITDANFVEVPSSKFQVPKTFAHPNAFGTWNFGTRNFTHRHFHLKRSQSVISSARRSAKAEVRGANPRESAILFTISDLRFTSGREVQALMEPTRTS